MNVKVPGNCRLGFSTTVEFKTEEIDGATVLQVRVLNNNAEPDTDPTMLTTELPLELLEVG